MQNEKTYILQQSFNVWILPGCPLEKQDLLIDRQSPGLLSHPLKWSESIKQKQTTH